MHLHMNKISQIMYVLKMNKIGPESVSFQPYVIFIHRYKNCGGRNSATHFILIHFQQQYLSTHVILSYYLSAEWEERQFLIWKNNGLLALSSFKFHFKIIIIFLHIQLIRLLNKSWPFDHNRYVRMKFCVGSKIRIQL